MALHVGAITVNPDGSTTITTPGMGPNIFTARAAQITFPDPNTPPPDWPSTPTDWHNQCLPVLISMKQDLVNEAIAYATGIIASITADAVVTVTTTTTVRHGPPGDGALQQAGGVDTTPPTADRTLGGTGTGTVS